MAFKDIGLLEVWNDKKMLKNNIYLPASFLNAFFANDLDYHKYCIHEVGILIYNFIIFSWFRDRLDT